MRADWSLCGVGDTYTGIKKSIKPTNFAFFCSVQAVINSEITNLLFAPSAYSKIRINMTAYSTAQMNIPAYCK